MANSIGEILSGAGRNEPEEIRIIKNYILEHYHVAASVSTGPKMITIVVPNAATAGTLRMQLHDLKQLCKTDKRLLIRIGSR